MPKRILLVDDEPDLIAILKLTLENKGYEILTAYDGEEGFRRAKEENPDLIILDILMPKGFGDDTANLLEKDPQTKGIPIIFFTNLPVQYLTGTECQGMQKDSKGNVYLQKSCTEEELITAINHFIKK